MEIIESYCDEIFVIINMQQNEYLIFAFAVSLVTENEQLIIDF